MKNERMETVLDTHEGPMKVVQIAGLLARRIVNYLNKNEPVSAGSKFGIIKFSSRTDLYVPKNANILIQKGQSVKGGQTILAQF